MTKQPDPVDAHVGARLRYRRMLLGMSQETLGERLGVTFQQIQKYEKGLNRIGASRLYQISLILDVPISFFFEDISPAEFGEARAYARAAHTDCGPLDFVSTPEGMQLNVAFRRIADCDTRRRIVDLVRALAASGGESGCDASG